MRLALRGIPRQAACECVNQSGARFSKLLKIFLSSS